MLTEAAPAPAESIAPPRPGPTVGAVVSALVLGLVFLIAVRPAVDNDLWSHLRTGQWMVDHLDWVGRDPFTHTRPDVVRVQTDWLGDLALYGTWAVAGLTGVALLVAGVLTAAMGVLQRCLAGPVKVRAGVVLLTAAASSIFWSARPQAFTFLFTVLVVVGLRAWRDRPHDVRIWWLVPLVLLWANVHGAVVYGLLVVVGTAVGEWLRPHLARRGWSWAGEPLPAAARRRLGAVAAACVAAIAVNPSGVRIYGLPFHQVASSARFVEEVQPPHLTDPTAAPFFLLAALLVALLVRRRRDLELVETALALVGLVLALRFTRCIPFFAVLAAPVVARHLAAVVRPPDPEWDAGATAPRGLVAIAGAVVALAVALAVTRVGAGYTEERTAAEFPVGAADWIRATEPPGELFNTFDWGGYVMWALPGHKVSVDGRTDVYDDHLDTYVATISAEPGWEDELDREHIGTVLIDPAAPLARALADDETWHQAYGDGVALVFVRADP